MHCACSLDRAPVMSGPEVLGMLVGGLFMKYAAKLSNLKFHWRSRRARRSATRSFTCATVHWQYTAYRSLSVRASRRLTELTQVHMITGRRTQSCETLESQAGVGASHLSTNCTSDMTCRKASQRLRHQPQGVATI